MSSIEYIKEKSILTISLNRPQVRNALNADLMRELTQVFSDTQLQSNISAIVLRGNGKSFCAGGDISWIKNTVHSPQNTSDIRVLYELLSTIYNCPYPVLCHIHGHAFGGGIGLTAACDIVAATEETVFAFSEVKLGVIPAVISLFVCRKVNPPSALELMLTGETFDTQMAFSKSLLDFVGTSDQVDQYIKDKCHKISSAGPQAVRHTKTLIRKCEKENFNFTNLESEAFSLFRECASSKEGQEGLAAFLEKRKPSWNQNVNKDNEL